MQVIAEVLAVQYALAALLLQVQALLRANQFLAKYRWGRGWGWAGQGVGGDGQLVGRELLPAFHPRCVISSEPPETCRRHSPPLLARCGRPLIPSLKPLFEPPAWRILGMLQPPWEQKL